MTFTDDQTDAYYVSTLAPIYQLLQVNLFSIHLIEIDLIFQNWELNMKFLKNDSSLMCIKYKKVMLVTKAFVHNYILC